MIAPKLLACEIANIAVTKYRREPESSGAIETGLRHFHKLNVALIEVDHIQVVDLATRTSLTAYDASYLWLSQTEDAELLTFDRKLLRASTA